MYKKSIGLRFLSFVIDIFMIFAIALLMNIAFGFGSLIASTNGIQFNLNFFEFTLVSFIYFVLFAFLVKGKTIGKLITRIEIMGSNLEEVPSKKIILREIFKSLLIIINFISFIVLLVNKDKKSIHDLIVNTIVVRKVNNKDIIYKGQ